MTATASASKRVIHTDDDILGNYGSLHKGIVIGKIPEDLSGSLGHGMYVEKYQELGRPYHLLYVQEAQALLKDGITVFIQVSESEQSEDC